MISTTPLEKNSSLLTKASPIIPSPRVYYYDKDIFQDCLSLMVTQNFE